MKIMLEQEALLSHGVPLFTVGDIQSSRDMEPYKFAPLLVYLLAEVGFYIYSKSKYTKPLIDGVCSSLQILLERDNDWSAILLFQKEKEKEAVFTKGKAEGGIDNPSYYLSLRQLVEIANPPNLNALLDLFRLYEKRGIQGVEVRPGYLANCSRISKEVIAASPVEQLKLSHIGVGSSL